MKGIDWKALFDGGAGGGVHSGVHSGGGGGWSGGGGRGRAGVGPARHCVIRHSTHFETLFLEPNGTL